MVQMPGVARHFPGALGASIPAAVAAGTLGGVFASRAMGPQVDAGGAAACEEDDEVCAVCLEGDSYEGNQILFCDRCNVPVHQLCYGVNDVPEGDYFCSACSAGVDPSKLECLLCGFEGGAFRRATDGGKFIGWVHALCAFWIPEVSISEDTGDISLTTLYSKAGRPRRSLTCSICNADKQACIQCSYGKCRAAFHPWCLLHRGKAIGARAHIRIHGKKETWSSYEAYCPKHASHSTSTSLYIMEGDGEESEFEAATDEDDEDDDMDVVEETRKGSRRSGRRRGRGDGGAEGGGGRRKASSRKGRSETRRLIAKACKASEMSSDAELEAEAVEPELGALAAPRAARCPSPEAQGPPARPAWEVRAVDLPSFFSNASQSFGSDTDSEAFWRVVSSFFPEDRDGRWVADAAAHVFGVPLSEERELGGVDVRDLQCLTGRRGSALRLPPLAWRVEPPPPGEEEGSAAWWVAQDGEDASIREASGSAAAVLSVLPLESDSDLSDAFLGWLRDDRKRSAGASAASAASAAEGRRPAAARGAGAAIVEGAQRFRVLLQHGEQQCACELDVIRVEGSAEEAAVRREKRLGDEWSFGALDAGGRGFLRVASVRAVGAPASFRLPDGRLIGEGGDSLSVMIRSLQAELLDSAAALQAELAEVSARVASAAEARKRQREAERAVGKAYQRHCAWQHVKAALLRGVRDKGKRFNELDTFVPASWRVSTNGRPKPTEDKDEDKSADSICCVCHDGDSTVENPILFCDGCNIPIHQACYGVLEVPEDDWFCDRCRAIQERGTEAEQACACCLCPKGEVHGALKRTADGRWAHVFCSLFHPGVQISKVENMAPLQLPEGVLAQLPPVGAPAAESAGAARLPQKDTCVLCQSSDGVCVKCTCGSCDAKFHVMCAWFAGFYFKLDEDARQLGAPAVSMDAQGRDLERLERHAYPRGLGFSVFCPLHHPVEAASRDLGEQIALRGKYRITAEQMLSVGKKRRKKNKRASLAGGRAPIVPDIIQGKFACGVCCAPATALGAGADADAGAGAGANGDADANADANADADADADGETSAEEGETEVEKRLRALGAWSGASAGPAGVRGGPREPSVPCSKCKVPVFASSVAGYVDLLKAEADADGDESSTTTSSGGGTPEKARAASEWTCAPCEAGRSSATTACKYCPRLGGVFMRTEEPNVFAHIMCVKAAKLPVVRDAAGSLVAQDVPLPEGPKPRCTICRRSGGVMAKCAKKSCTCSFHVSCHRITGCFSCYDVSKEDLKARREAAAEAQPPKPPRAESASPPPPGSSQDAAAAAPVDAVEAAPAETKEPTGEAQGAQQGAPQGCESAAEASGGTAEAPATPATPAAPAAPAAPTAPAVPGVPAAERPKAPGAMSDVSRWCLRTASGGGGGEASFKKAEDAARRVAAQAREREEMMSLQYYCPKHVPAGLTKSEGGHWVDAGAIQRLRDHMDIVRNIAYLVERRERRCKKRSLKLREDLFEAELALVRRRAREGAAVKNGEMRALHAVRCRISDQQARSYAATLRAAERREREAQLKRDVEEMLERRRRERQGREDEHVLREGLGGLVERLVGPGDASFTLRVRQPSLCAEWDCDFRGGAMAGAVHGYRGLPAEDGEPRRAPTRAERVSLERVLHEVLVALRDHRVPCDEADADLYSSYEAPMTRGGVRRRKAAAGKKAPPLGTRQLSEKFWQLPDRSELPAYYEVIRRPLPLDAVHRRLQRGRYDSVASFSRDVLGLVVGNAKLFNEEDTPVFQDAVRLEELYEERLAAAQSLPKPQKTRPTLLGDVIEPQTEAERPKSRRAAAGAARAALVSNGPSAEELMVGKRIQVFWSGDSKWYSGIVDAFEPVSGKHRILYDDGEWEFAVLSKLQLRNEDPDAADAAAAAEESSCAADADAAGGAGEADGAEKADEADEADEAEEPKKASETPRRGKGKRRSPEGSRQQTSERKKPKLEARAGVARAALRRKQALRATPPRAVRATPPRGVRATPPRSAKRSTR